MSWDTHIGMAEHLLKSSKVPASEEIITLIKKVNPTKLCLSEADRERGYQLKAKLQNLLLENYGKCFHLAPHPYNSDIVLIKHQFLLSIDACHAHLKTLSLRACDTVGEFVVNAPQGGGTSKPAGQKRPKGETAPAYSTKKALTTAQQLLEQYEYAGAEDVLAAIRITDSEELPTLIKAARILLEEMGAYNRTIGVLLAQPKQVIKEKAVRELLAFSYYSNGMFAEARAIFDSLHPAELGKESLHAYADISFKDGNLSHAFNLLKVADQMDGFVTAFASLRRDVEASMQAEAEPWQQEAEAAFNRNEFAEARSLALGALARYPNCQKARELISGLESRKTEVEIRVLWEQLGEIECRSEKIEFLARLLECDKGNREKIKHLIATEKSLQKREQVDSRVAALRLFAEQENWPECFDILQWLSHQEDDQEQCRAAFSISPNFSVLYQNKRLQRLSDDAGKELWLSFMQVKTLLLTGQGRGCFERLQSMRQYFHHYQTFREVYGKSLGIEQEKARQVVGDLLAQLHKEERSWEEAKVIAASLHKTVSVLPAEESARHLLAVEERVNQLKPEKTEQQIIDMYRSALLIGNSAKAALFGEQVADKDALRAIDAEIAERFKISAEPIEIRISPDMDIDLVSETRVFKIIGLSDRHVMLREDHETLILVDLIQMKATRFKSPHFKRLVPLDSIPSKDIFLFRNGNSGNTVWRAKLCPSQGCFVASFQISDQFSLEEGDVVKGIYLSSSRESDYYLYIHGKNETKPWRVEKQSLDNKNRTVKNCMSKESRKAKMCRLSYEPDNFLEVTGYDTSIYNNKLEQKAHLPVATPMLTVDLSKGQFWVCDAGRATLVDSRLWRVKRYEESMSSACYAGSVGGLSPATDTILFAISYQTCMFYNMVTNKFSNTFNFNRILRTSCPSTWYCYQFERGGSILTLRDITGEIGDFLEWRVFFSPDNDPETNAACMRGLHHGFALAPKTPPRTAQDSEEPF